MMQARGYGIVFLWVTFSFCAVVQPTTVPQQELPDSFGEVLEEIERDGFELRDYLYPYNDGFVHYLVTLLENDAVQSANGLVSELRIYRSDSQGTQFLGREVVAGMHLAFHELNNTDINGDGTREIVIWKGCGSTAWSCQQIGVYQISGNRLINLTESITGSLVPSSLVDVDQDGSLEIIAMETRWETYEHLPHPVAPAVEEIFAWSNGSYRRASKEYPDYYQKKINHIKSLMDQISLPYDYLGNAIKLLLNYDRMGQTQRGWEELERLLQTERHSIVENDVWQSIKDPIVEDFKKELGRSD
ncbi:MAG: hypothetical protein IH937_05030 [Acidobacteria bacterium]|nr:hypothetical protein [Acidobacteriota bacterium]